MMWAVLSLNVGLLAACVGLALTNAHAKTLELRIELLGREVESLRLVAKAHQKWLAGVNEALGAGREKPS